MIILKLKNSTEFKFNLKNFDREKNLYTYWYAVSDMKTYKKKKIKINTDGKTISYEVGEIVGCEFKEEIYVPLDTENKSDKNTLKNLALNLDMDFNKIPKSIRERALLFLKGLVDENIYLEVKDMCDPKLLHIFWEAINSDDQNVNVFIAQYKEYYNYHKKGLP